MLTGTDLGAAIRAALDRKREETGHSYAQVAREIFGIRPESVQGWMDTGRISKPNFERLRTYVADIVGPEHWGLITPTSGPPKSLAPPSEIERALAYLDTVRPAKAASLRAQILEAAEDAEIAHHQQPKKAKRPATLSSRSVA